MPVSAIQAIDAQMLMDKKSKMQKAYGKNKGGPTMSKPGLGGPSDKPYIVNPDGTITFIKVKKNMGGKMKMSNYYSGGKVFTGR